MGSARPELAVEQFGLLDPLGPEALVLGGFVGVAQAEEGVNEFVVFTILKRILVFKLLLVLARVEGHGVHRSLLYLFFYKVLPRKLLLAVILVGHPVELHKETAVTFELLVVA